jgi:uncharacterized protein (TIGR00255 family)
MLRSMTAYGRSSHVSKLGRLGVEIQSVNRKHLEIHPVLPKEFFRFDADIKKLIGQHVGRGQITVKISVQFEREAPISIIPNIPLAKQIKAAWEQIALELELTSLPNELLGILSNESELIYYHDELKEEESYRQWIIEAVSQALTELVTCKVYEGTFLQQDIIMRLEKATVYAAKIALKAPGATERYRHRLIERLAEISSGSYLNNEEKILKEVAIFAEKIDIVEELKRFDCHLKHFNELLLSDEIVIGKKLDFIVQELNREMTTIGSKSSDYDVAYYVVEAKSELERIREQIQNVE